MIGVIGGTAQAPLGLKARDDILPCPFCGGFCEQREGLHHMSDVKIGCTVCDAEGPLYDEDGATAQDNAAAAIRHWNHRYQAANGSGS